MNIRKVLNAYLALAAIAGAGCTLLFGTLYFRNRHAAGLEYAAKPGAAMASVISEYGPPDAIGDIDAQLRSEKKGELYGNPIPDECRKIYTYQFGGTFRGMTYCLVLADGQDRIIKTIWHYS